LLEQQVVFLYLTLPKYKNIPSQIFQLLHIPAISDHISIEFFVPIIDIARRPCGLRAPFVLMPETAVDQDDFLMARQNNVGFSR